jgi:hypothetical protein
MDRDEQRKRTVQGLRSLEGEVRELVDIARFPTQGELKLFKIQFERVRERISEFEKDLIDLLVCYPEARDTLPLSRLLAERSVMKKPAALDDESLARLHADLGALYSELRTAPADGQPALRKQIADKEREIREAGR